MKFHNRSLESYVVDDRVEVYLSEAHPDAGFHDQNGTNVKHWKVDLHQKNRAGIEPVLKHDPMLSIEQSNTSIISAPRLCPRR